MPCPSTANSGLIARNNRYFKNALTQINLQNDPEKKQCICDCDILIDENKRPYIFPLGTGPYIVGDEVYSILLSSCTVGGGSFQLKRVDPQKMMDLVYGLKSVNVSWQDRTSGGTCSDSEAPKESVASGTIDVPNSTKTIDRLCTPPLLAQTLPNTFLGECDNDPELFNGYIMLGFYSGSAYNPYFFLQEEYEEPECGQPGPILYIASCEDQTSTSGAIPNYSVNVYVSKSSVNGKPINKLIKINSIELDTV